MTADRRLTLTVTPPDPWPTDEAANRWRWTVTGGRGGDLGYGTASSRRSAWRQVRHAARKIDAQLHSPPIPESEEWEPS